MFSRAALLVLLAAAGCGHEAWLGMQCALSDVRCDAAGSGAHDAGTSGSASIPSDAAAKSTDNNTSVAAVAGSDGAPQMSRDGCRSVTMSYFACAIGDELPGAPWLQGGRAYTLRFQSTYTVDTTFSIQGVTSACAPRMFGTITLLAGQTAAERCLTPSDDVVLLVTVMSGDVQVWAQDGVRAELCDGCD